MTEGALCILYVDDNPGDLQLANEALEDMRGRVHLFTVNDGDDALDFLRQRGWFRHALRPNLILLDLNMPRKHGLAVLRDIKTDVHLKSIPVVVFTGSSAPYDIAEAYRLRANAYVVKPVELEAFTSALQEISHFWHDAAITIDREERI